MKAVVLAAGEGVRLQPITSTRPKHLIKVGGKPILEHCLNALKACGIEETIVVVHYMADAIRQYLGDGQRLGMKIEYVEQEAVLGTGNAVAVAEPFIKDEFMLVYGDLLFGAEAVRAVMSLHRKEKPTATMAVVPVDKPESYGIVELENENHVRAIVEKPKAGEAPSNLANAGIFAFSPEILGKIKETKASARGEWEITDAVGLLLAEKKPFLAAKISRDDWFDVGRPWDLLEANRWALNLMTHRVLGKIENGATLVGPVTVSESARIRSCAYIEGPTFIGEESDVGPNCFIRPYTSIGNKVRVGNACEIKESIVMDSVHIGHLSYVGDSVLGEKCNLGAGTITGNYRFDAGPVKMIVKGEVVDSGRRKLGAILGDNVKTGIGALLMPGVKIGCNSWIGPGTVIQRDVPPDTVVLLKQNLEENRLNKQ